MSADDFVSTHFIHLSVIVMDLSDFYKFFQHLVTENSQASKIMKPVKRADRCTSTLNLACTKEKSTINTIVKNKNNKNNAEKDMTSI